MIKDEPSVSGVLNRVALRLASNFLARNEISSAVVDSRTVGERHAMLMSTSLATNKYHPLLLHL